MEEQLQPPVQPSDQTDPYVAPPANKFPVWLPFVIGFIALALAGIIAVIQITRTISRVNTSSAPTLQPTPTIPRPLSTIATNSAFLLLESSVNSLFGRVSALSTQDTTLTPPTLTLPLGFSQ